MINRFDSEGREVLRLGLREALSLGHNYIGPEHIMLALCRLQSPRLLGVFDEQEIRNRIISGLPVHEPKAKRLELLEARVDELECKAGETG